MTTIISLCLISILIILSIILLIKQIRIKNSINDMSSLLYSILMNRDSRIIDSINDLNSNINKNEDAILTLSNRIEINKLQSTNIIPQPEEAKKIDMTIKDCLQTEIALSKHNRAPRKDSVRFIIDNVISAYPHISKEYIIKRIFAFIQNWE